MPTVHNVIDWERPIILDRKVLVAALVGVLALTVLAVVLYFTDQSSTHHQYKQWIDSSEKELIQLNVKRGGLEKQINKLDYEYKQSESEWKYEVAVRHPSWTHRDRDRQFFILDDKWTRGVINYTNTQSALSDMQQFGWKAGYEDADLTGDDYRSIIRCRKYSRDGYHESIRLGSELSRVQSDIEPSPAVSFE